MTTMSRTLAGSALRPHSTTARASATRVVEVRALLKTKSQTKVRGGGASGWAQARRRLIEVSRRSSNRPNRPSVRLTC